MYLRRFFNQTVGGLNSALCYCLILTEAAAQLTDSLAVQQLEPEYTANRTLILYGLKTLKERFYPVSVSSWFFCKVSVRRSLALLVRLSQVMYIQSVPRSKHTTSRLQKPVS